MVCPSSNQLSFFKSTLSQFPITKESYYYGVGEVEPCHFECWAVARCMAASVFSRRCDTSFTPDKASFLLSFHGFQLLVGSCIFGFYLFQLNGGGSVSLHQVHRMAGRIFQLGKADFYLCDGGRRRRRLWFAWFVVWAHQWLWRRLVHPSCSFSFHDSDFIFPVVQYE